MKILAVDDDETILDLLAEALALAGHDRISRARSAHEALGTIAATTTPFDCLLLDIQMPGMDGIALCREVRSLAPYAHAPILMLTAMSQRDYIERAFMAGATDYITKPFDLIELSSRIGMAHRLVQERHRVADGLDTIEKLKRELRTVPALSLADPFDLGPVPRAISYLAFENYILSLSRARSFASNVMAVKIRDIERIHAEHRAAEFVARLRLVAEALSEATEGEASVLSYRGNGMFLCVSHHRAAMTPQDVERHVNDSILAGQGLSVIVGERISLGAFTRFGSLQSLHKAAAAVERRQDLPSATGSAPRSLPQRSLARYRGEQERTAYEGMLRQVLSEDLARLRGELNANAGPGSSLRPAPSRHRVP
ncbi:response regulator [Rhodobacteraceae bacterium HSP-20]|uniref:Response regulator n=1 Tax=Paragemmobacter amnigenus TaxID=2852097 RepID=A0ABS6IYS1_9RHOB|nr:response regulator [Rhodobacter amnigenus]MBU9696664.1 response regulator [Rhodobacter amnigenus]MBV4387891.1 response regulator [Rhodobacter amnigenus]